MEKINITEDKSAGLEHLIDAARDEKWVFVDGNINASHLGREQIYWALTTGLADSDKNIRDLAATLLDKSDEPLDMIETNGIKKIMMSDIYHIVRYRLAIALYKRGDRSPEVEEKMHEAENDPDVGEIAKSFLAE